VDRDKSERLLKEAFVLQNRLTLSPRRSSFSLKGTTRRLAPPEFSNLALERRRFSTSLNGMSRLKINYRQHDSSRFLDPVKKITAQSQEISRLGGQPFIYDLSC
jgi:hypothetical protein